jgi:Zn-dependent protease with chaperone function
VFSNLLFIVFVLLLVSLNPERALIPLVSSPIDAFLFGLFLYSITLGIIYLQNVFLKKYLSKVKTLLCFVVNIELIIFLSFFYFFLEGQRIFEYLPLVSKWQIFITVFSLTLYLGGIWFFHYTFSIMQQTASFRKFKNSSDYAFLQLRLVFPFAIPFLIFTLLVDLSKLFPTASISVNTQLGSLLILCAALIFMILMMILLPAIIQWIWQCRPIPNSELKEKLDNLCQKANFTHAGIKTWTVMNQSYTAAIIGIVPRFRYIMFTQKLLDQLSPAAITAILAHEIGHSYRKHLLLYPLIIFGMMLAASLFSVIFTIPLEQFLRLQNQLHPSSLWALLEPLAIFVPYVLIIAVYFRLIFGYFSRLFERQADLHVFHLELPPQDMIEALNTVAIKSGYSHKHPSWHHYSIEQRIDFLNATIENPNLIEKHHKRVRANIWGFCTLLFFMIFILIAGFFPERVGFKEANNISLHLMEKVDNQLNNGLRKKINEN